MSIGKREILQQRSIVRSPPHPSPLPQIARDKHRSNEDLDRANNSGERGQNEPFAYGPLVRVLGALSLFLVMATPFAGPYASAQQADQSASQSDDAPFGDLLEGLEGTGEADREAAGDDGDATESDVVAPDTNSIPAASDLATPPLFRAQRAMGEAVRLLAEEQLSASTQSAQQQALDALDAFIEQSLAASADKSPSDQQASQQQEGDQQRQADVSSQEGDGQNDSDDRQAEASGEQTDAAATRPGQAPEASIDDFAGPLSQPMEQAVWGHLPERLREQLQATLPEEFLPAYEQAIRDYFTRLSEMSNADGE